MKYAKKLKLSITPADLNRPGPVLGAYGGTADTPDGRLIRKYMSSKQEDAIRQAIPEAIRPYFMGANYSEIKLLRAHTHIDDKAVINFYRQANGEVTTFWEGNAKDDHVSTVDSGNRYIGVDHNSVAPAEHFVAQSGDVWILNSAQPHSVSRPYDIYPDDSHFIPIEGTARYVAQAYFTAPFSLIVEELTKAGLVESS